jgi:hypothetical protein
LDERMFGISRDLAAFISPEGTEIISYKPKQLAFMRKFHKHHLDPINSCLRIMKEYKITPYREKESKLRENLILSEVYEQQQCACLNYMHVAENRLDSKWRRIEKDVTDPGCECVYHKEKERINSMVYAKDVPKKYETSGSIPVIKEKCNTPDMPIPLYHITSHLQDEELSLHAKLEKKNQTRITKDHIRFGTWDDEDSNSLLFEVDHYKRQRFDAFFNMVLRYDHESIAKMFDCKEKCIADYGLMRKLGWSLMGNPNTDRTSTLACYSPKNGFGYYWVLRFFSSISLGESRLHYISKHMSAVGGSNKRYLEYFASGSPDFGIFDKKKSVYCARVDKRKFEDSAKRFLRHF